MFTRWKQWRHSRHSLLAAGLCLLTVMVTLDSSKMAVASSSRPPAVAAVTSLERSAVASRLAPNGQFRRVVPRGTAAAPAPAPSVSLIPAGPGPAPGAPIVASLSPDAVSAGGGATVTITGTGFSEASAVYFGTNESSQFEVISPTTITATAPADAGSVGVSVTTPLGSSGETQGSQLTYTPTGQLPITASGQNLEVGGVPTKFTGVNAYELATDWGTNAGCGGIGTPGADRFSVLFVGSRLHSALLGLSGQPWPRMSTPVRSIGRRLTRSFTWRLSTTCICCRLSPTREGPATETTGRIRPGTPAATGTSSTPPQAFTAPASTHCRTGPTCRNWSTATRIRRPLRCGSRSPSLRRLPVLRRISHSTAAGTKPVPAESTAAADLLSFFNVVGGEIHALDPAHLVEAGFLGGGQCGTSGSDYETVGASPGIDVLSVHDYYGSAALGGDQWNGLAVRFAQASALQKPIITGEVGIQAGNGPSCESLAQRALDMSNKMRAQFAAGSSAFLVWDWAAVPLGPCSYNTGPGDPLMTSLGAGA